MTDLVLPPLMQPSLPQRCSFLVCLPAQKGHVGCSCLQSWEGCPNLQQLRHCVMGDDENIFSHLRGREKSLMESVRRFAWSGVTETTIEVVAFKRSSGFGFKKRAPEMIAPLE
jgi:hypothetical protein